MDDLKLIAGWPLEDGDKVHVATFAHYRAAVARVARLEAALKETLFGRVAERMGHDLAARMDQSGWEKWPEEVAFIDQRIERARKALLDIQ